MALFIGFLVVAYAIVSLQLFAMDNMYEIFKNMTVTNYIYRYVNDDGSTMSINFNDFGQAVLSLTVLITHENYPDIM